MEKKKMEGMIKAREKANNMSQAELADIIGTTQRIISDIENMHYNATQKMLKRIAVALNVEVKDLY